MKEFLERLFQEAVQDAQAREKAEQDRKDALIMQQEESANQFFVKLFGIAPDEIHGDVVQKDGVFLRYDEPESDDGDRLYNKHFHVIQTCPKCQNTLYSNKSCETAKDVAVTAHHFVADCHACKSKLYRHNETHEEQLLEVLTRIAVALEQERKQ